MNRKMGLSLISMALFFSIFGFQNCAKSVFEDATRSEAEEKDSGNGGNYDGKISYVYMDSRNLCSDGSNVHSRIDKIKVKYLLMRENCLDLNPQELNSETVKLDASGQFLTYSEKLFTKVRDPWLQPFSSTSIWNLSIGSGALWSQNSDLDTIDLRTAGAGIAAGEWSSPYFLGNQSDPTRTVKSPDLVDQVLSFPFGFHLSGPSNGSKAFILMDPTKRYLYQYTACRLTSTGYTCDYGVRDDSCGNGLGGFDLARGMMRAWEIQNGEIQHAIRFALPLTLLKPTEVAWPAQSQDFTEGLPNSNGNFIYGSTIGLPGAIDLDTLGLSRGGKILAKALQEYGAIQRDSSGTSGGLVLYAEESAESLPELAEMRADLAKIVPHLKVMRNQTPTTVNGGGLPRQQALPSLDPAICQ